MTVKQIMIFKHYRRLMMRSEVCFLSLCKFQLSFYNFEESFLLFSALSHIVQSIQVSLIHPVYYIKTH